MNWTRLSCHGFVDNQVRLQLFALAYNLGNFLRRLALPRSVKTWLLRTLREKLIKIGAKVVTYSRYAVFQMAEVNETFWEALHVNTDLGMNLVRGNNQVTQLSFGGGIGYDATDFETQINATTIINEQTAAEDTRRATLDATYTHKFDGGWEAIGLYQFESDEQQNLNGRSLFGGAIGKRRETLTYDQLGIATLA